MRCEYVWVKSYKWQYLPIPFQKPTEGLNQTEKKNLKDNFFTANEMWMSANKKLKMTIPAYHFSKGYQGGKPKGKKI